MYNEFASIFSEYIEYNSFSFERKIVLAKLTEISNNDFQQSLSQPLFIKYIICYSSEKNSETVVFMRYCFIVRENVIEYDVCQGFLF